MAQGLSSFKTVAPPSMTGQLNAICEGSWWDSPFDDILNRFMNVKIFNTNDA
jgi:hypothetical protein